MKHIQDYVNKIEQAISSLDKPKPTRGGLLSPTNTRQSDKSTKTNDLMVIANFVAGIRSAKKEIKNAK